MNSDEKDEQIIMKFRKSSRRDRHVLIAYIPLRIVTSYGNHFDYSSSIKNLSFIFQYTPMRVNIKHQQLIKFSNV
jgi:hypothetical protein